MADSAAPPAAIVHPSPDPRYTLPELPKVAGLQIERVVMDGFRLAVAKLIADAWGMEAEKIVQGVDVGELTRKSAR